MENAVLYWAFMASEMALFYRLALHSFGKAWYANKPAAVFYTVYFFTVLTGLFKAMEYSVGLKA